jgi:hypothetical protein
MTFKAIDVVNTLAANGGRADPKSIKTKVVVYEASVFLRKLHPHGDWKSCANRLMGLLTSNFTSELIGCEYLMIVLDVYIHKCSHRSFVGQTRQPTPQPDSLDLAEFMDLRTARQPVDKEFDWLISHKPWRTKVFTPWLACTMPWPETSEKIKTIHLRGFGEHMSEAVFSPGVLPPCDGDESRPCSKSLLELFISGYTKNKAPITALRKVNEVDQSWVNDKAPEADDYASSWVFLACKAFMDPEEQNTRNLGIHVVSGDGDLLWKTFCVDQLYEAINEEPIPQGCLFVTIDSQVGTFDIAKFKDGLTRTWMAMIQNELGAKAMPAELEDQLPMLACCMMLLAGGDTSSSVPQVTALNITKALAKYIANRGKYPVPPPPLMDQTGKINLLPPRPEHYAKFVYWDQNNRVHVNPQAFMSLIQYAGGFTWFRNHFYSPEPVPGTNKSKRKEMSVGYVLAHIERMRYTIDLSYHEMRSTPQELDMFNTPFTGYARNTTGEIYQVPEITDQLVVFQQAYNHLGPER